MTTLIPTAPARPAEQARAAISVIFLITGALYATWAVNIPGVRDALNLSAAQIGLALLAVGIGSLISMPLTGGWTGRWGSHQVTRFLVVAAMLSLITPFFMPDLLTLFLALVLLGFLNGALDVAMNAQGVTVEQGVGRPVMSRLHAYFSLGGLLGAGLGTLLVGRLPMTMHILLVAVVTALAGLLAGRFLIPDRPVPAPRADGSPPVRLLSPAVLLLGALCFLGMLTEGANYDWATLYYRDVLGVPGGNAGIGYAAFVAAMTLGRWFGDRLRTRLGDQTIVRGGALLAALGLALVLLTRHPAAATLGFTLSGLGLSNVVPVMYGTAGHALHGRGIATVATVGYGGFLLVPPAIGFVAEHAGLPAALGLAAAGAALVALLGGRAFGLVRAAGAAQQD